MSDCNERIEVDYADKSKRKPGETWSLRCSKEDDDHKLHESRILWLTTHKETTPSEAYGPWE